MTTAIAAVSGRAARRHGIAEATMKLHCVYQLSSCQSAVGSCGRSVSRSLGQFGLFELSAEPSV